MAAGPEAAAGHAMAAGLLELEEEETEAFHGPLAVDLRGLLGRLTADPQACAGHASMGQDVAPRWCSVRSPAHGVATDSLTCPRPRRRT